MTESWERDPKIEWWSRNSPRLDYGVVEKIRRLGPIFRGLDAGGALGLRMLEVGSGVNSPLNFLLDYTIPNRVMLGVDVVHVSSASNAAKQIRYDVREIGKPWTFATRRAIVQGAQKIGIETPLPKEPQLDSIFFFEILNYVDYKAVITNYARFLKTGGKIVILNNPERCPPDYVMDDLRGELSEDGKRYDGRRLFDKHGAKSNLELAQFVDDAFVIEPGYPQYPWGLEDSVGKTPGEDLTFMFLVARKK